MVQDSSKSREFGTDYSDDMEFGMLVQSTAEAFDVLLFIEMTALTRILPLPSF
jgi:hypothetical protein